MKNRRILTTISLLVFISLVFSGCGAAGASIFMNDGSVVNIGDATVQTPENAEGAPAVTGDTATAQPDQTAAEGTPSGENAGASGGSADGSDPYITGGGISPYYKPENDTASGDTATTAAPAENTDMIWSENRGDTSTLGNTDTQFNTYTPAETTPEVVTRLSTDIYVGTYGSDETGDGTYDNPFATIQKALDTVTAGHTIYLLSGIYSGANTFTASGSGSGRITVTAYPGSAVTVQLAPGEMGAIFDINGHTDITISNIRIGNSYAQWVYGVLMTGGESNITIENCEISNISTTASPGAGGAYAVLAYGKGSTENETINNVVIYDNDIFNLYTGLCEGVAASGNVSNIHVDGNTIYEISNIGVDLIGGIGYCSDQNLDHPRNCEITGNTVYHCVSPFAACAGIYVSGCRDCIIRDNYVYENAYGIEVADENYNMYYPTENISIDANTVHNNHDSGITIGGVNPITSGYVRNSSITKNILYNNGLYINDGANGEIHFEKCDTIDVSDNIIRNHDYKNAVIGCSLTSEYVKNVKFNNNLYAYDKPEKIVFKFQGNDYIGLDNWNKFTGGTDINAVKSGDKTK